MSDSTSSATSVELDLTPTPENLLRWAWRLGGHAREPTPKERRELRRKACALIAGKARRRSRANGPGCGPGSEDSMMRFLALLFANAGDAALLDRLRSMPPERRNATLLRYGVKPWRGAAGRAAAGRSKAQGKAQRVARALQLHLEGLSNREIAEALGVSTKTVERALKGRRARRRTGGANRGARGRFGRGG